MKQHMVTHEDGCETWSLTLREGHRLRMFENRVLRRIFGSKWEEDMGGYRRLHNEEHRNLYASSNIIRVIKSRRMRWVGHGRDEKCMQNLDGKPEGKKPLGRPRCTWEDNIKMELREMGWKSGLDTCGSE
jgi:hypothetical protein